MTLVSTGRLAVFARPYRSTPRLGTRPSAGRETIILPSLCGIFWVGQDRYEIAEGGLIQR
jgi:hypothetical protein